MRSDSWQLAAIERMIRSLSFGTIAEENSIVLKTSLVHFGSFQFSCFGIRKAGSTQQRERVKAETPRGGVAEGLQLLSEKIDVIFELKACKKLVGP